MDFKKIASTYVVAVIVGLYTTFVVQSLWNWFAVKAFGVPSVSYWEMYGATMLLGLLLTRDGDSAKDDQNWKTAFMLLDACVPPHKKDEVADEMKSRLDLIGLDVVMMAFGKVVSNTLTLALGWAVYTHFLYQPEPLSQTAV